MWIGTGIGRTGREAIQEISVKNRQAYRIMAEAGLLHKPKCRNAELYQAAKLFELLPDAPNDLWQTDVTYIHIPGHGWWYAITVIDYYSRYLLAAYLTSSYSTAEAIRALALARAEAERLCGPLTSQPLETRTSSGRGLTQNSVRKLHLNCVQKECHNPRFR